MLTMVMMTGVDDGSGVDAEDNNGSGVGNDDANISGVGTDNDNESCVEKMLMLMTTMALMLMTS